MNRKQNPTDRHLIKQYREGEVSALPILVKRYHRLFCEKAFWITKDADLAKDVAQESWIIIIKKLDALKNLDSFKSWAYRIVYTKAIDRINRRNKESRSLEDFGLIDCNSESSENIDNPIQTLLLKAIRQLPKEKQDIIRLFYSEEYSIIEISEFLSIPKGTVKSRLFKAREKLKSLIKK